MAAVSRLGISHKSLLLPKFQGALVGAVLGDCIGAHFEFKAVTLESILGYVAEIEAARTNGKERRLRFTDDTAMTRSVATSLIDKGHLQVKDVAHRFVTEYFKEPRRGYGSNVKNVFKELRTEGCSEPHGPAARMFGGNGSLGNGGAMRISPAALYGYFLDEQNLNKLVSDITKITHSHQDAINGAILQCKAVHLALQQPSSTELDTVKFIDQLHQTMHKLEGYELTHDGKHSASAPQRKHKRKCENEPAPYCYKLKRIAEMLEGEQDPTPDQFEEVIGTDVTALAAVPAAIYSFARCTKDVSNISRSNPFERTIIHAISLGGDTDTIASMAGAIAGAYYGIDKAPDCWKDVCEGAQDAISHADKLHKLLDEA